MSKSKSQKRWSNEWPELKVPRGQMWGHVNDPEILERLGTICSRWPHIEEAMIGILAELLPGRHAEDTTPAARHIFRGLVSQQVRIGVMRTLLQKGRQNRDMEAKYDEVIDEFERTNTLRNRYVHGLWWSHENGQTFLQPADVNELGHRAARRVTVKELDIFLGRLNFLLMKIHFT